MLSTIVNALRGALIGVAEVIPGVSGGTVALIVGIYERLIDAIADTVTAARRALGLTHDGRSVSRAAAGIRALPWAMLVPVGLGMVVALVLGARFIEPLLEEQPVAMRALFLGLVLAGAYVPAHMVLRTAPGRWRPREILIVAAVGAVTFVLMGLPPGDVADPGPIAIVASAAMAICALVLPGVSGSFLLLTIGMYEPTIAAVNDRDLAYLGLFALGAIVGLVRVRQRPALAARQPRAHHARRHRRPHARLPAGAVAVAGGGPRAARSDHAGGPRHRPVPGRHRRRRRAHRDRAPLRRLGGAGRTSPAESREPADARRLRQAEVRQLVGRAVLQPTLHDRRARTPIDDDRDAGDLARRPRAARRQR